MPMRLIECAISLALVPVLGVFVTCPCTLQVVHHVID